MIRSARVYSRSIACTGPVAEDHESAPIDIQQIAATQSSDFGLFIKDRWTAQHGST
eukprot:m.59167 g.59167  ORF g.59167 m.59167 type:complete len:56 (-) comp17308_c0_seq2:801-968(-)